MTAAGSRRLRTAQRVLAVLISILVLGLFGSLAGPSWQPERLHGTLVVTDADPTISAPGTDAVGTYEVSTTDLPIDVDGVPLVARLIAPIGAPADRPGVVFLHGAGTADHTNFDDQADALASAGVYVLVPDKRMDTYTTRSRDYEQMARDYLASWELLAATPGVDPDDVGIYGESEGAWIAPVAAVLQPKVAFLILVSAPVVPPREQAAFAMDNYLRNTHVPWPVFRVIPRVTGAQIPGGGFEYADFDPQRWQRQLTVPVLMIYGTADRSMPLIQGPIQMRDDMAAAGNTSLTVRYISGANHGIRIGEQLAPGYPQVLAAWALGLPGTADQAPQVAGAQPTQLHQAEPVPSPHWFATGNLLVIGPALALALAWGPVLADAARRRYRRQPSTRRAHLTSRSVLMSTVMHVSFLGYCGLVGYLSTNYRTSDVVVIGGWVVVQLLGVAAVAAAVASVARARPWVRGAGLSFGWWSAHVGVLGGLLVAGYWGVFPALL